MNTILEKLDKMDEKLDEILMELRLKKPVLKKPYTSELTKKEEQSLRKLEQEWEDDEDDALKVSKETEVILMDLTKVTVIAQSGKALLVLKEGYQKWVPFSQMLDGNPEVEDGHFFQNIPLTDKAEKWMHDKPWDKFKVVKNRAG